MWYGIIQFTYITLHLVTESFLVRMRLEFEAICSGPFVSQLRKLKPRKYFKIPKNQISAPKFPKLSQVTDPLGSQQIFHDAPSTK